MAASDGSFYYPRALAAQYRANQARQAQAQAQAQEHSDQEQEQREAQIQADQLMAEQLNAEEEHYLFNESIRSANENDAARVMAAGNTPFPPQGARLPTTWASAQIPRDRIVDRSGARTPGLPPNASVSVPPRPQTAMATASGTGGPPPGRVVNSHGAWTPDLPQWRQGNANASASASANARTNARSFIPPVIPRSSSSMSTSTQSSTPSSLSPAQPFPEPPARFRTTTPFIPPVIPSSSSTSVENSTLRAPHGQTDPVPFIPPPPGAQRLPPGQVHSPAAQALSPTWASTRRPFMPPVVPAPHPDPFPGPGQGPGGHAQGVPGAPRHGYRPWYPAGYAHGQRGQRPQPNGNGNGGQNPNPNPNARRPVIPAPPIPQPVPHVHPLKQVHVPLLPRPPPPVVPFIPPPPKEHEQQAYKREMRALANRTDPTPFIPPLPVDNTAKKKEDTKRSVTPRPILKNKPASAVSLKEVVEEHKKKEGRNVLKKRPTQARRRESKVEVPNVDVHVESPSSEDGEGSSSEEQGEGEQSSSEASPEESDEDGSEQEGDDESLSDDPKKRAKKEKRDLERERERVLNGLRAHVTVFTAPFKCSGCDGMVKSPRPPSILNDISNSKDASPTTPFTHLDTSLHLSCPLCRTIHCRGCHRPARCKRSCAGAPSDTACALPACCRAGRAVGVFEILEAFDGAVGVLMKDGREAQKGSGKTGEKGMEERDGKEIGEWLGEVLISPTSSKAMRLSGLILDVLEALRPWIPLAVNGNTTTINAKPTTSGKDGRRPHSSLSTSTGSSSQSQFHPTRSRSPHVHTSLPALLYTSLLLPMLHAFLRLPARLWVRPTHSGLYSAILEFLEVLEKAGAANTCRNGEGGAGEKPGPLGVCVFEKKRGVRATKGVGGVVWGLSDAEGKDLKSKKPLPRSQSKIRKLWNPGPSMESFSQLLGRPELKRELDSVKAKIKADDAEKVKMVDDFSCTLLRWQMSDMLS